ncbi:MAG: YhcH/YjgK/YiaL family protein, partial [Pygmaiobacter massiliensis]|nr:YhcH/YjgK/YiaL family protein [Pygmaiobacter massiliensis]
MIYDLKENALLYKGISPQIDEALELVAGKSLEQFSPGKTPVSVCVMVNVMTYTTKPQAEIFEAHQQHADIHVVFSGAETVAVTALNQLQTEQAYDAQKDCALLRGSISSRNQVTNKHFILCLPEDAHITGLD